MQFLLYSILFIYQPFNLILFPFSDYRKHLTLLLHFKDKIIYFLIVSLHLYEILLNNFSFTIEYLFGCFIDLTDLLIQCFCSFQESITSQMKLKLYQFFTWCVLKIMWLDLYLLKYAYFPFDGILPLKLFSYC